MSPSLKQRLFNVLLLAVVLVALAVGGLWYAVYGRGAGPRVNVLSAHGAATVTVMDFSRPFPLDPPPPGWYHRKFLTREPMTMSFQVKDGIAALRLATDASASMLYRHVDIDLDRYPILSWRWYIEQPIDSPLDERTRAGDDHPARLFISLETTDRRARKLEIIWGNKLQRGAYKFIDKFPHYVADGGDRHLRQWRRESVDLKAIYEKLWPDALPARVVDIALFCDSDDTKGRSIAYFEDVEMRRAASRAPAD